MTQPPERVRITRSHRPAPSGQPDLRREIESQTALGSVYLDGLIRAQLRLALRVLAAGAIALGGLPLLFFLLPATHHATVFGLPFSYLVLGILVYPAAVLMARQYVRAAERIEDEFTREVHRS
ncbi:hypothetical protein [Calidifontibacter terrae]